MEASEGSAEERNDSDSITAAQQEKKKKLSAEKNKVKKSAKPQQPKKTRQQQKNAHQEKKKKKKSLDESRTSTATGVSSTQNKNKSSVSKTVDVIPKKVVDKGSCLGGGTSANKEGVIVGGSSSQLKQPNGSKAYQALSTPITTAPTNTFSSAFGSVSRNATSKNNTSAIITTTAKPFTFKTSKLNTLDDQPDVEPLKAALALRRLGRDQKLTKTVVGGKAIDTSTHGDLMTRKAVERLRTKVTAADIATILQLPFATCHLIVPGLYLTGAFGLTRESFKEGAIRVVINATIELPLLTADAASNPSDGKVLQEPLLNYRVPVEDDPTHKIAVYFDDVADLVETARRRGSGSVIHCAAGVSRSTTLVLAYLLKYTDMSLLEAFRHTRTIRPVIRPNMGFMKQLIEYEGTVQTGRAKSPSVRMVSKVVDAPAAGGGRVTVTVPDFYPTEYPDLYEGEVRKQISAVKQLAPSVPPVSTSATSPSTSASILGAANGAHK